MGVYGVKVTGRAVSPVATMEGIGRSWFCSMASARSKVVKRRSRAIAHSIRASGAPRQKCTPCPNARWRTWWVRVMSNRSASGPCATGSPPAAAKLEGAAKDEVLKKYQAQIQTMLDHLTGIKEALRKNDNQDARKHYEALKPFTEPNHGAQFE